MSTRRLHGKFMAASGYELSFSLFRKFRPKNILLVEANCFRTGLCEQFLNVTFKTHACEPIFFGRILKEYNIRYILRYCFFHRNFSPNQNIIVVVRYIIGKQLFYLCQRYENWSYGLLFGTYLISMFHLHFYC